ncbi:MAG: hypothetical protein WEA11_02500, partial [Acidimicrobiales bacterium]
FSVSALPKLLSGPCVGLPRRPITLGRGSQRDRVRPGSGRDGVPTLGAKDWPSYDLVLRSTAIFGKEISVEDNPNDKVRQAWHS